MPKKTPYELYVESLGGEKPAKQGKTYATGHTPSAQELGMAPDKPTTPATTTKARGHRGLVQAPGGSSNLSIGKKLLTPEAVKRVQNFLSQHGYKIKVDGIAGPQTKAAIRDFFRPGKNAGLGPVMESILGTTKIPAGARKPGRFNAQYGEGHSPVYLQPDANGNPPKGSTTPVPNPGTDPPSSSGPSISSLTAALIKRATGGVGDMIPLSLSLAAGAPYDALAASLQSQIGQNPDAKAQALHDIDHWFGQVTKALGTAQSRDKDITDAAADSLGNASQAIIASLGGSAMPGAGTVGAIGQGGVNTVKAMGAAQQELANDLGPILSDERAGAKKSASADFDQKLLDLQNQLAQARGQATAADANAQVGIMGQNNQTAQQNYSNLAGILNVLSALQASGYKTQSAALLNALRLKRLQQDPNSFAAASPKSRAMVAQQITATIGQQLGSGMDWPAALKFARNTVRENGWNPLDPAVVKTIIQPALTNAGVHFLNPQTLYQP